MISLRRPTDEAIASYRDARVGAAPTCAPATSLPPGFRHERFGRTIGTGDADFRRARLGLQQWAAHRGSGIDVFPAEVEVATGETVVIVTRQLGLWVLAACRISTVVDEPTVYGFTYSTLPDHPECGYESFTVRLDSGTVRFDIEATSKPDTPLVRLGGPVTRELQRRAASAYLDGLAQWTDPTR